MAAPAPPTGGKRKRSSAPTPTATPTTLLTPSHAPSITASGPSTASQPIAGSNDSSPSEHRERKKRRGRKSQSSMPADAYHASPHATPNSTTKHSVLVVEYRCLNGKSWTVPLDPKAALADLSYDAAKRSRLQETGVRLVYKRGPGQEQDIYDDYDLSALRARASANPRAPIVIMVYPAAGPSSAPSSTSSSSDEYDSPPSTPSHVALHDNTHDLYYTPAYEPSNHDIPPSSTSSNTTANGKAAEGNRKERRKSVGPKQATPAVTPATPNEPSPARSVRFANGTSTPQWHSTPIHMRPPTHLKHLHQPMRPSPLAQSSRADSDAGSEVDLDLGRDDGEGDTTVGPSAVPIASVPETAAAAKKGSKKKVPVATSGATGDSGSTASAGEGVSSGATASTEVASSAAAPVVEKKKRGPKKKAATAGPINGTDEADAAASTAQTGQLATSIAASSSAVTPIQPKKRGRPPKNTTPAPGNAVSGIPSPAGIHTASTPESGAANVTKKQPRAKKAAEASAAVAVGATGPGAQGNADAPTEGAGAEDSVSADVAGEPVAVKPKRKAKEMEASTTPASDVPPETGAAHAETAVPATPAIGVAAKKAPKGKAAKVQNAVTTPNTPASNSDRAAFLRQMAQDVLRDIQAQEAARQGPASNSAAEATPPSNESPAVGSAIVNAEDIDNAETAQVAAPPAKKKAPVRRKSQIEVEIPLKSPTKTPSRPPAARRPSDNPAEEGGAHATAADDVPAPKKRGRPTKVVEVELTSPSKRANALTAPDFAQGQQARADETAATAKAPKKRAPRKSKTAGAEAVEPVAVETDGDEVAAPAEDDVVSAPPKKKARNSTGAAALENPIRPGGGAQNENPAQVPNADAESEALQAAPSAIDDAAAAATGATVDASDAPSAKRKGGRKSAATTPAVVPVQMTPLAETSAPTDGAANSSPSIAPVGSVDDANRTDTSESAAPVSRNELLAVQGKKQPRPACCVICGVKSTHMQKNCPTVKEGLTALEDRLQVVQQEMEGRDKECSEEAIQWWIKELKEKPAKIKARAQAKGAKKADAVKLAERTADTPESEEGSGGLGDEQTGNVGGRKEQEEVAEADAQDVTASQKVASVPAEPAADNVDAVAVDAGDSSIPAAVEELQKTAEVSTANSVVNAVAQADLSVVPAATPRPAAPFAHVPRFGFDDPTETPLPPYLQNFNKKGRKQGSISGVSATTAAIETEKSDSESESESDSDASGLSRSSRSRSYSSSADSEGSAERVRVRSADIDDRIRQEEDEEMGSDVDEEGSEGESGDDEMSDAEETPGAPASQRTPTVYRIAKPPNTGHLSDTSDDGEENESSEEGGSDNDSGSDDQSDSIASPTDMPPRKSLPLADDPNDPEAMFKAVFSKPLSQVKKAEVQARAARMSDVHLQPQDGEEEDDESVDSSSEGHPQQRFRGDSESVIGDFGDVGSEAGDEVEEPESQSIEPIEPPVVERQTESIEAEEDTTPKADAVPLKAAGANADVSADAEVEHETTPPPPARSDSSANTPSRRRFTDMEASAGPSQEVDNLPGAIALEEARSEEDQAENDVMLSGREEEVMTGTPAIATQLAQSQPSPRRTRGSQRVRERLSASQPATPVKAASVSQSQQNKRSTRLKPARAASQAPDAAVEDAEHAAAVDGGPIQSEPAIASTPRPKRVASPDMSKTASLPVKGNVSDQEDQLDSSSRPVTPEPTPRRVTRRTPSVSASPSQGTRRSTRLRSSSVDPIIPESSQPASQETQQTRLFMSQSQPLYTQAYKLMPDSLESGSITDATTPMGRKTPARRVRPSSPIAEEDENASTPRANGSHVPESSPVVSTKDVNDAHAANGSPAAPEANGADAQAPSELDDGFTEGDSFVFTPVQRPMSQPKPLPPVSFAPSLGSLNMDQLRKGGATLAGYLGFGSHSQKALPSQRASLPSQANQDAFGLEDSESEADLDSEDEEEATPHVGSRAKALARYASAKDSAVKPKTKTGGRMSGW